MTETRRLYLLRHAQAQPSGPSDHQRKLDAQGEADALALGRLLAGRLKAPLEIVSSDSARTRGTVAALLAAGVEASVHYDAALYHGGEDAYRAAAAAGRGDRMIVGHNPVIGAFARTLARSGDAIGRETLSRGFPTSSLAILRFDAAGLDDGVLEELLIPPHRPR